MDTHNNKDASTGASAVESGYATCTRNGVVEPLQGREYRDGSRQVHENITSRRRYSMPMYQDGTGEEERCTYVSRYDIERRDRDEDMLNYDRRQAGQPRDSSRYGPEVRYWNNIEPHGVRYVTPLVARPLPVKLPAYSGKEEWATWIAQFENYCEQVPLERRREA
ncbi:hypothetical protein DPMN_076690 [Dreissena polymorpha]|uniref:Uncharacterized protein n=1 Tax=Dreissena polymorpha TaxID=45954 RepID=A0A9D3YP46_DREPO|nr:hypothetical protein DPMN_076690 [Dreissena polymorpha]